MKQKDNSPLKYKLIVRWWSIRDWFLRIWFCHHNARVIADFEDRMTSVIYDATGGMMSKPYYTKGVMCAEINEYIQKQYDEGYKEGFSDGVCEMKRKRKEKNKR